MRNEERHIGACLDSILANNYPGEKLEILVVDGQSSDRSREIVQAKLQHNHQIRLLENPQRITPVAMNTGILASKGDVIFIICAHARISSTLISLSVQTLQDYPEVDAVGGIIVSESEGTIGKAIALAINSPIGSGGPQYRVRRTPGPIFDTIAHAAYRRAVFDRVGLVNEELVRNQDAEFNYRFLQQGGRIHFNPEIVSYVSVRDSLPQLAKQQFRTGYWKVRLFQEVFLTTNWRHLVPVVFVIVTVVSGIAAIFSVWGRWILMADVGAYAAAVVISSCFIGIRHGPRYLLLLPWVFSVIHLSYGIGMSKGFWDFGILSARKRTSGKAEP